MTESEYAAQLVSLGGKVHFHDGVWWLRVKRGFCRPVWRNRCFAPKAVKPNFIEAFLGYAHGTDVLQDSGVSYKVMRRDLGDDNSFDISSLSSNRRSKIRRGLKRIDVRLVDDIQPMLPRMMEVVVDARNRTGSGLSVQYYERHGASWQKTIQKLAGMKDNYFLVALKEGVVVAYYHLVVVGKTMSITAAKSHTDYLKEYPNDALIFTALDNAYNHWGCNSVWFGDYADDPTLNQFKQGYGFQCVEIPKYECLRPGVGIVKRFIKKRH